MACSYGPVYSLDFLKSVSLFSIFQLHLRLVSLSGLDPEQFSSLKDAS